MFAIEDIGLESRTCLLPMITEDSRALMQLFTHYKNGFMPFAGGVYDQPAVFGEAMALIESRAQKMKGD